VAAVALAGRRGRHPGEHLRHTVKGAHLLATSGAPVPLRTDIDKAVGTFITSSSCGRSSSGVGPARARARGEHGGGSSGARSRWEHGGRAARARARGEYGGGATRARARARGEHCGRAARARARWKHGCRAPGARARWEDGGSIFTSSSELGHLALLHSKLDHEATDAGRLGRAGALLVTGAGALPRVHTAILAAKGEGAAARLLPNLHPLFKILTS